ncbi:7428_t:CDS:2 [Diversispora eburnea]|uniref:7428_t:CDS:1 n=1 Tax=Diversispora eburnea TaxID=1213867 RepID=A0A9N9A8N7_9GLOM|nr:7428_t:CDS:2 [Diversispora eburnea]
MTNEKGIGIIDIGSNGIRFGLVSSLQRHLPVLYEERAPISLFDAQNDDDNTERKPISKEIIDDVINCLQRFKFISKHYEIDNIKVIATEATRTAPNSEEFLFRIYEATGLKVEKLCEADEARITAMGIIATYYEVEGLVMDMGGGSMELNFVIHHPKDNDGIINMSEFPINLPYGAAALKKLLKEAKDQQKRSQLFNTIKTRLEEGFKKLNPPESIKGENGYTVYMNGGGFRSLGYLSMSEEMKQNSYPMPIINGYGILAKKLVEITDRFLDKPKFLSGNPFRISKRREKLLPAACFLFKVLMEVIPLDYVYFCEGGVRHGQCFDLLSPIQHQKDPLESFIFSHPFQSPYLTVQYRDHLVNIIKEGIPSGLYDILDHDEYSIKKSNRLERLLPNLVCLAHWSMNLAKESRPIAAFYLPLAGGPLSDAPGLTHTDRAIISWCLMWRYHEDASGAKSGGVEKDISNMNPSLFDNVKELIPAGRDGRMACEIIGKFIGFVILTHPGFPKIENIKSLCKFKVTEKIIENSKRRRYNVQLTIFGTEEFRERTEHKYLVNNSIVKKISKKLEKSYELIEEKNQVITDEVMSIQNRKRRKRGYHLGEIHIRVNFSEIME